MAEKAKKTANKKKPTTKTTKTTSAKKTAAKPVIKSSVTGKKATCEKPAIGKIVCLCVTVIAILVVIAAIMLRGQTLGSNYFVSDGTKYVLNILSDEDSEEDGFVAMRYVYFYKDNDITGVKVYYEFVDNDTAKKYYDELEAAIKDGSAEDVEATYELNGKYVVATANESTYADLTAEEIKSIIELYEKSQNEDNAEGDAE